MTPCFRVFACALACILASAPFVPADAQTVDWNSTFQGLGGPTGPVGPMAIWDDGSGEALYAGAGTSAGLGLFTAAGGLSASYIARWNGVGWSPLGKGLNAPPTSIVAFGNLLVVGGSFTRAGDVAVPGVAAWDGKRWRALDTGFAARRLVTHQGELYAAGSVNRVELPYNVAKWDGRRWMELGPGMDQPITDLAVHAGQLVALGWFNLVGTDSVRKIARWDGSSWTQVGTGIGGNPSHLIVHQGELVAAGGNPVLGSARIARFDGQAWHGLPFPYTPLSLASHDNQLLVGTSGTFGGLRSVDSQGSQVYAGGADGAVRGLLGHAGRLYVGGAFGRVGSLQANRIAVFEAQGWRALGAGLDGPVLAYAEYGNELVVAGRFRGAGGVLSQGVLRWNGSQWHGLGDGAGNEVYRLAVQGGRLMAAGPLNDSFYSMQVQAWDGQQWQRLGAFQGDVNDIVTYGNLLVAAGGFSFVDTLAVDKVAGWDGQQWLPLGTSPFVQFTRLIVFGGELIGFGQSSTPGSAAARWNGQSWVPMGQLQDFPRTATVHAGELYVGGSALWRWNGQDWESIAGLDFNINALLSHDGALHAAGSRPDGSNVSVMRRAGASWEPVGASVDLGFASLGSYHGRLLAGGNFSRFGERVLPFLAAYGPALESATAIVAATPAAASAGTPVELRVEVSAQAAPTVGHVTITASPGGSCTDAELEPQDASTSVARCTITWATACTRELVADYVGATDGTQVWQSSRSAPVLLEVTGATPCTDEVLFDSGFE